MKYIFFTTLFIATILTNNFAQKSIQAKLQSQFESVENGGVIILEAGIFELDQTLILKDKKGVTVKGAGVKKTILSFKKQQKGVGFEIIDADNIEVEGITIQNTRDEAVRIQNASKVTCSDIHTKWTAKSKKSNGAYGFSIRDCKKVMVNNYEIVGASSAGIYVDQSDKVTLRLGNIHQNASGIKIENTTNAEIYKNTIHNNGNGLIIFDSPNSNQKEGRFSRVYNNRIVANNYKKLSSKKNQRFCPRGTGILIAASNDVELFENDIEAHQSFGIMITSYFFIDKGVEHPNFNPYSYRIYIHDNHFKRQEQRSAFRGELKSKIGKEFKKNLPDIGLDGIFSPNHVNEYGWLNDGYRICIKDNDTAILVDFDAAHDFKKLDTKPYPFRCELAPFKGLIDDPYKEQKYESNEAKQ